MIRYRILIMLAYLLLFYSELTACIANDLTIDEFYYYNPILWRTSLEFLFVYGCYYISKWCG